MNLGDLNSAQREAVLSEAARLAVVAGPGTGKTRVLTHRIVHFIIERGVDPEEIAAITFTNQAAEEMRERLKGPLQGRLPFIGTIHQWGLRFLGGSGAAKSVIDEEESWLIFPRVASECGISREEARRAFKEIGRLRQEAQPISCPEPEAELLDAYLRRLRELGLWDFDDLIHLPLQAIRGQGAVPPHRHLFVDEFQDLSPVQFELVRAMVENRDCSTLTVIGDPRQAIYGFRGASPRFMEEFLTWFPNGQVVTLREAYRSPQRFLDCAFSLVDAGDTSLRSMRGEGPRVTMKRFASPKQEARWVADTITRLMGGLDFISSSAEEHLCDGFGAFGVLFRVHAVGREVASALEEAGIPYQFPGGRRGPSRGEQVIRHLKGALGGDSRASGHKRILEAMGFSGLVEELAAMKGGGPSPETLARMLGRAGIEMEPHEIAPLWNRPFDPLIRKEEADHLEIEADRVALMSLHASKGLEFPVVFIVGCEEGIIPWPESPEDEERRLLFVGMTRAQERLFISSTRRKMLMGRPLPGAPSPLLRQLPGHLVELDRPKGGAKKKRRKRGRQPSLFG